MIRFFCLIFLALTVLAAAQVPQDLTVTTPSGETTVVKSDALGRETEVHVTDPNDGSERVYRAFLLEPVLDDAFGGAWRMAGSTLVFHCRDGYRCMVPAATILKNEAYLAYGREGGKPFEVYSRAQQKVAQLAPYYLIWSSKSDPTVKEISSVWPYQIVKVELETESEASEGVRPPEGSSQQVMSGFEAFSHYCLTCHTMNGRGGSKAPDLNYPVNVTEYFQESWLARLISNPRDVRWNASMPPLNTRIPNREQTIRDIIAYLKSMKEKKLAPPEK